MENHYAQRKLLRKLEKRWSWLEILINRLTTSDFNPLYHLGTLGIYLLIVITITGIYLTIIYRPGAEVAYATVERISGNWFGSLMRSIHRYASDAFLLVTVLHALKTFLSDRFWGSRWLAWISGWLMVFLAWAIGTMGYWLIWDVRSQWMTEVLYNNTGGGIALTFLNPEMASSTFAAFVIVLFVHIFLPLAFLFLIILHILRLARGRLWSPRWVMILSGAALVLLSVLKPVMSEAPANLSQFIETVRLDAWYLGFLPVLEKLGVTGFNVLILAAFGLAIALPWIARGKHEGPAIIHEAECNGCGLCASECPYRAIEMHYRDDEISRFKSIAVINADLCTGCGLCVGTCATLGIELKELPTQDVFENGIQKAVETAVAQNQNPMVLFTCQRHASLDSLPKNLHIEHWTDQSVQIHSPVYKGEWHANDAVYPTLTCVLPCIGMVDVDWVKALNKQAVRDIQFLGCPYDDCNSREGVQWEAMRLRRRKGILATNMHWQEAGPGDPGAVEILMAESLRPENQKQKPHLPDVRERKGLRPQTVTAGLLLAIFSLIMALALPLDFNSQSQFAGESQVRLLVEHSGIVAERTGSSSIVLPDDATVDLAQIMSGVPYPIHVQAWIDNAIVIDEIYEASGVRGDGTIKGMATYTLSPGQHTLEIRINDDESSLRTIYTGAINLEPSQIITLIYDQETDRFLPGH